MLISALSLVTIFPALLVVWVGERITLKVSPQYAQRGQILFLGFSAVAILIYFSLYAGSFADGDFPILVLVLLPTLEGLLALLLIRWRDILAVWKTNKVLLSGLLIAMLALLASLGRSSGAVTAPVAIVLLALFAALIWDASQRSGRKALEIGAVLVAVFLFLDAAGVLSGPTVMNSDWLKGTYYIARFFVEIFALILTASLIQRRSNGLNVGSESRSMPIIAIVFILLLALVGMLFRNGVMVEATGRAAEDHAPLIEILCAILIGMVMIGASKDKGRIKGFAFTIFVPVLIAGAYMAGWLLDPQAITQARAGRVAQAVEQYNRDNGIYPYSLEELTPHYMPFILGPLTGRGQVWCYQGVLHAYRLGYVYFQRYSPATFPEPYSEIRVYSSVGDPLQGSWICDDQLQKSKDTLGF